MALDGMDARSRRNVLLAGLGGLGAAVAVVVTSPLTAQAANSDVVHVGDFDLKGSVATGITSSGDLALRGTTSSTSSDAVGVLGSSTAVSTGGIGVFGQSQSGIGVSGESDGHDGTGVYGFYTLSTGFGIGVQGVTQADRGIGTTGAAMAPSGATTGVWGTAQSPGGIGVHGQSGGRGGVFEGVKAPLRLIPNKAASTHPHSGAAGDLFVDKASRLWFCKGGAHWKQIA